MLFSIFMRYVYPYGHYNVLMVPKRSYRHVSTIIWCTIYAGSGRKGCNKFLTVSKKNNVMEKENVILVDSNDKEIGYAEKYSCHKHPTKLHRAFSVFIFNAKNQMLITKRNSDKKTWPGLWSNACCSHPRKGEKTEDGAKRRAKEELGISVLLSYLFKFEYSASYDKTWGENEVDHVFVGKFDGKIVPNKGEIEDWKFADVEELKNDIKKNPDKYTPWFKICLDRVIETLGK